MSKLKIVDVGNKYGNMNLNAKFYPMNFKKKDRERSFNLRRKQMGDNYGFDGLKMYMASQEKHDGSYFEITEEYVNEFPFGWTNIKEDILVMSDEVEKVAIGHPVADCPLVVAFDKRQKVVAVGHCSADLTDKMLPKAIIDSLAFLYDSKTEDIVAYISSGASKKSYLYDSYPIWARDEKVWNEMIEEDESGVYHIDIKGAIKKQLLNRNIEEKNITVSEIDTVTNPDFYSNRAEFLGEKNKKGRNFPCAFFVEEKQLVRKRVR